MFSKYKKEIFSTVKEIYAEFLRQTLTSEELKEYRERRKMSGALMNLIGETVLSHLKYHLSKKFKMTEEFILMNGSVLWQYKSPNHYFGGRNPIELYEIQGAHPDHWKMMTPWIMMRPVGQEIVDPELNQIIDFETFNVLPHFKATQPEHSWETPPPPEFIWSKTKDTPPNVKYIGSLILTNLLNYELIANRQAMKTLQRVESIIYESKELLNLIRYIIQKEKS